MEETGTTIHSRLTRRNNFLRENPQSGHFVAGAPVQDIGVIGGQISTCRTEETPE
jgi:hypothetical protein